MPPCPTPPHWLSAGPTTASPPSPSSGSTAFRPPADRQAAGRRHPQCRHRQGPSLRPERPRRAALCAHPGALACAAARPRRRRGALVPRSPRQVHPAPLAPVAAPTAAPEGPGLIDNLVHLAAHICKWPIGDPKKPGLQLLRPAAAKAATRAPHERLGVLPGQLPGAPTVIRSSGARARGPRLKPVPERLAVTPPLSFAMPSPRPRPTRLGLRREPTE